MKLSSKARYGLKAMCILAQSYDSVVSLSQIADTASLSPAYLEQLIATLKKAGLVVATRGAGGGYKLSREPAKINVGDIVRVLEDDLEIVDCISGECANKCNCSTHVVWQKMYDAINDALDNITLESLLGGNTDE